MSQLPAPLQLSASEVERSASFVNHLRGRGQNEDRYDYAPDFLVSLARTESKDTRLPVGVLAVTRRALNEMPDAQLLAWIVRLMSKNPAVNRCDHVRILADPYSCQPFVTMTTICETWHDATRGTGGLFHSEGGMWLEGAK